MYALVTWRKAGALRWLGHLDVARTFDRAVRRARLPVVYSEGFSPRAAISFADALALGVGGENELCLIRLERPMAAEAIAEMLAAQMPEQLEVVGVRILPRGQGKPFSRLSRAEYEIELWPVADLPAETFKEAVRRVQQAGALPVTRESKSRVCEIDIKPHLYALHLTEPDVDHPGVRLQMSLGYGQERLVKPLEVLSCIAQQLSELTGEQIALQPRLTTRLGLY